MLHFGARLIGLWHHAHILGQSAVVAHITGQSAAICRLCERVKHITAPVLYRVLRLVKAELHTDGRLALATARIDFTDSTTGQGDSFWWVVAMSAGQDLDVPCQRYA
jgi:hypothetical protein